MESQTNLPHLSRAGIEPAHQAQQTCSTESPRGDSWDATSTIHEPQADAADVGNEAALTNHFYGTISVNPVTAKTRFATLIDEVVEHFTLQLGVDVTISVEMEARTKDGFSESLQRTIKENCNVLKFNTAEFERE